MRRVLVIDDDAQLGRAVARTLREELREVAEDVTIDIEADPRRALRRLRAIRYEIAIVDILMPDMTGDDLVRRLLASPGPHPLVLLVSGRTDDELADLAGACGANATLARPFSAAALGAIVTSWLVRSTPIPPA